MGHDARQVTPDRARTRAIIRHAARLAAVAAVAWGAGTAAAQLVDELVDELIEERVERAVERAVLGAVERDLAAALGRTVAELEPPPAERFVAALDEHGAPVERDVRVVLVEPERAAAIERLGFEVRERRLLAGLDLVLLRVELTPTGAAESALLDERLAARVDHNHLYRATTPPPPSPSPPGARTLADADDGAPGVGITIVDGDVATDHPALRGAEIEVRDLVTYDRPRPRRHGTAVTSILATRARGARLTVASVFFDDGSGGATATTAGLVRALDAAVVAGSSLVNMSLAGPPNRVLEVAVDRTVAAGCIVVAAVGNAGPAAPPLYPAAYPAVVGVTAIDGAGRVWRYANRGPQVAFAAPGVDVDVADPRGGTRRESGTSFAAPYATAAIARLLARAPAADPLPRLRASAIDLGPSGVDETYGHGRIVLPD